MDSEKTKQEYIEITGIRENNLNNIDVSLPRNSFTVITGLSGSGKSSLALDTIYTEGIRRYIECLSTYARQFLERMDRPDFDDIRGLPTAIAIESRNNVRNSRSTVGTTTEIYDYLRLLFAKTGRIHCPECGEEVVENTPQTVANSLISLHSGKRALINIPAADNTSDPSLYISGGFSRLYCNGEIFDLDQIEKIPPRSQIIIDRIVIEKDSVSRISESFDTAFNESHEIYVVIPGEKTLRYTRTLECPACSIEFKKPTPNLFSFNSPQGACGNCNGFGNILEIDKQLVVPDPQRSLVQGAVEPFTKPSYRPQQRKLLNFAKGCSIDITSPFESLSDEEKELLFNGNSEYYGILGFFERLEEKSYKMHIRVLLSRYRSAIPCAVCSGSRLKKESLYVHINGRNIFELTNMSVDEFSVFINDLTLSEYEKRISGDILREIEARTGFLLKSGLGYLTLSRLTRTLSGGEAQRINLACQLGSSLTETLYILDEPSIGLHPRDIDKLLSIITELKSRNNTVVVVEHDSKMIVSSDYIIELGPSAGEKGGNVVFQGTTEQFINSGIGSYTHKFINGDSFIEIPERRRSEADSYLKFKGASHNNLKNIDVEIPLNRFVCITGVSGSGKSTLTKDVIYNNLARKFRNETEIPGSVREISGTEYINDVIMLDQSPVGRSSRSNPATYIKVYDEIRKVFADTLKGKLKGLTPSDFSFNVKGGRCEECKGEGKQKVEMHFLADVIITCPECNGKRFRKKILDYRYRGKNIDEILDLTVDDAALFFGDNKKILKGLELLRDVGLGYIRLGQPAVTLSGGEAQRLKIARELSRKNGSLILYILDEPTVGLHAYDVSKLVTVLNRLVDSGNSVVVIEHNLDLIECSDYIIDLGPEGGEKGGSIIAKGTPEEISRASNSYTGRYLKKYLY